MALGDLDRYIGRLCGGEFECSVFRPRFVELTEFMIGDKIAECLMLDKKVVSGRLKELKDDKYLLREGRGYIMLIHQR